MSWGNKLFCSLAARARRLRYLFPEGSGVKSVFEGCVGSSTMLVALQMERVLKLSVMKGREAQMIFSNARCRVLQSDTVQLPYQTVMQLLRMLSIVPL